MSIRQTYISSENGVFAIFVPFVANTQCLTCSGPQGCERCCVAVTRVFPRFLKTDTGSSAGLIYTLLQ